MRALSAVSLLLMSSLLPGAPCAAAPAMFVADVPFTDCEGLVCLAATLDGKPATLLFDTGNVNSTLISDVARDIGWTLEPIVRDAKPLPGIFRGGAHHLALGALDIEAKWLAFDRAQLGDHVPPAQGTLAYTAFKDRIVQIDYAAHRLRIGPVQGTDAGTGAAPASDTHGAVKFVTFGKQGPPIVVIGPFALGGHAFAAQFDSAFTGALMFYDAALPGLGLSRPPGAATAFFPYTDGGIHLLAGAPTTVSFAGITLGKAVAPLFVPAGDHDVHQPDGLFEATVGNALFQGRVVTLDLHAMTVTVAPRS